MSRPRQLAAAISEARLGLAGPVAALVAEVALLTALIGPSIKLRWKLSIQVRGKGAIRTIAADYFAPAAEGEPSAFAP